jgi:hypothetical protein
MTMSKIKMIGLALVAAMAVSAITVASAAALLPQPQFKGTKIPDTFTSENVLPNEPTLASFITSLGTEKNISCEMSKDNGEVATPDSVNKITVHYTGCKEVGTTSKCGNNPGAASGLILTKELHGLIGYVNLPGNNVGVELLPNTQPFVKFECEGEAKAVTVEGCTIGEATPLNVSSTKGELTFRKKGTEHAQEWTKLDGRSECVLKVKAGFFGLGTGPSWVLDQEEEMFATAIELEA